MKIASVDFFYASMPEVTLDADGSQDALLVCVTDDAGQVGWGECEASPLVSIAAFVTPRSHGLCQPVGESVIGERLDGPDDIERISRLVERNSMDLLQAAHTFSGIEIALWDLLGRRRDEPVWRLLGFERSHPKLPYASMLFGSTPQHTLDRVSNAVAEGFHAVKLGWSGFGEGEVDIDVEHLVAAREALGEGVLLVDAGQAWGTDVEAATARAPGLAAAQATWIEEPFLPHAYAAHAQLGQILRAGPTRVAAGEAATSAHMATNLIDYGNVGYIQVDTGRIGGIGPAHKVALHADRSQARFVNHTFTSQLALSASLQPFAGLAEHTLCEYPVAASVLARAITSRSIAMNADGTISAPDAPGLGLEIDLEAIEPWLRDVSIFVDDLPIYASHTRPR